LSLRPYQQAAVDAVWAQIHRHCYASLPTGSGKSHVIAELCRRALEYPETRVVVLAHVRELIEQNAEKIAAALPNTDVAIYCAGLREKRIGVVTVASVQSLARIKDTLPSIDLFIVDEAHRIPHGDIGQYRALFAAQPEAKVIGMTATPYRLKGGLLHEGDDALFDLLAYECKTGDLIDEGWLSPVKARSGSAHADTSGLHVRGGEFITTELIDAFDRATLTASAVDDVVNLAHGRNSIMVFCCSVAHCFKVRNELMRRGIASVAVITGETDSQTRADTIKAFKGRTLRVLVNCDVLTTGFDAPNVDCIVMLRATKSPGLYVQILGRGLRKAEGKTDCLFLDYGQNVERHGCVDWITAKRVQSGDGDAPVKTCPECEAYVMAGKRICPHCGYVWPEREIEATLTNRAGSLDPIRGAVRVEKKDVQEVRYYAVRKSDKPPMLRVEYRTSWTEYYQKFVCLEHNNGARHFAEQWFARHGMIAPNTVDEAMRNVNTLPKPKTITVKLGGKWPEVINYEF
jgi:DNA repair protein RadD